MTAAATAVRPVLLDERAVYLSPTGRRCRWWPHASPGFDGSWAVFLYDKEDGTPAVRWNADGFFLTPKNLRVLRRVA